MPDSTPPAPTLYIVATPIGNLEDMTHRAVRVLRDADIIAAEDTRHTQRLLRHYEIGTRVTSYHEHNEAEKTGPLLQELAAGRSVALVTDAGTPCISDPGFRLVRAARAAGHPVVPIPGACAAVAALSASGLPTDSFAFHGFFPRKRAQALALLERLRERGETHIVYEAPRRAPDTIALIGEVLPDADIAVARELTKLHEQFIHAKAADLLERLEDFPTRGEYVILFTPAPPGTPGWTSTDLREAVEAAMERDALSRRDAIRAVAEQYGVPRNAVYAAATGEPDA